MLNEVETYHGREPYKKNKQSFANKLCLFVFILPASS